jgi:hypothetical protein
VRPKSAYAALPGGRDRDRLQRSDRGGRSVELEAELGGRGDGGNSRDEGGEHVEGTVDSSGADSKEC